MPRDFFSFASQADCINNLMKQAADDDFSDVDDVSVNPCSRMKEDVQSLKEGDFVQVELEGRRRKVVYYGKILSFEADRVRVRFMEKVQNTDKFTWADTDYIMQEQIVGKVKQPELAEGCGILFVFKQNFPLITLKLKPWFLFFSVFLFEIF